MTLKATLPSDYQNFIHLSRYSRWLDDKGRRETWNETVTRYINFLKEHVTDNVEMSKKDRKELFDILDTIKQRILKLGIMGSMRTMMTAGEALKRDHVANFSCSYDAANSLRIYDEMVYILMCGAGEGFSVEKAYVSKMPFSAESFFETDTVIVVEDSKIGWAKAYREFVSLLFVGQIPKWDVSRVRPKGAKLKTFGGRASGPEPLVELFKYTINTVRRFAGKQLPTIAVFDLLCKVADIVVVGGVRRSALICLSDVDDDYMRKAKSNFNIIEYTLLGKNDNGDRKYSVLVNDVPYGERSLIVELDDWESEDLQANHKLHWMHVHPERQLANISSCYDGKPKIGVFMTEWKALYDSKSGERGIVNREALIKKAGENGRRNTEYTEYGVNPCFTGDMKLLTRNGYFSFKELCNTEVGIVKPDGGISEGRVWCSGSKQVYEIRFTNRDSITCTKDHVFQTNKGDCQAEFLKDARLIPFITIRDNWTNDDFLAGFIQGDGCTGRLKSVAHKGLEVNFSKKDKDIVEMYLDEGAKHGKRTWYSAYAREMVEIWGLSTESLPTRDLPSEYSHSRSFIAGLYSANGCVVKGHRVSLKTTNKNVATSLKEALQDEYNIASYITVNKAKKVKFPNGEYICRESYDLNISRFDSIQRFAENISFGQGYKRKALAELIRSKSPIVISVKPIGKQEVFDFSEPEGNWGIVEGVVAHNCVEAILMLMQFCNLTEEAARRGDTLKILEEKMRYQVILGTIQSTFTKFRYLRNKWKINTEEERLLGSSITGIMDHAVLSGQEGESKLVQWLTKLKKVAIDTNKEWADKMNINQSAAITCIKPSGTVSQLVDSSSGIHARHSPYYVRTVRIDKKDPMYSFMVDKKFPHEDVIGKEDTTAIFMFPIKSPEGSIFRTDRTAIEQLNLWLIYKKHFCEHSPSITVTVKEDEWMSTGAWVYENFDNVTGIAFLPFSEHSYKQAPYQECSKEDYDEALKNMPKNIDWNELSKYEDDDNTEGSQSLACVGESCEIA